MTATDELRALLDERGVEWEDGGEGSTIIPVQDGVPQAWTVNTWPSGKDMGDCLWVQNRHPLTPSQAIDATLGRGTCHIVKTWSDSDYVDGWRYRCSECMCFIPVNERDPETGDVISAANYCTNCGRRVIDAGEVDE